MPVLKNAKHERFAQELAKGKTADEAYELAGFKANRGNATRLKANESITARLAELLERAAVRTEITIASLTDTLLRLAQKGEALGDGPGFSVARASVMDAAKLNGLITDKVDLNAKHDLSDEMTAWLDQRG